MSDYKLVPVEPTAEMLEAGKYALEAGCYASGIYADMLAAAPVVNIVATKNEQGQIVSVSLQDEDHRVLKVIAEAAVQGEPVAYISHTSEGDILGWERQFDAPSHTPLYTDPQPAEQQSCPVCKGCGLNPLTDAPVACANCHGVTPAEQKPAPDVAGLESALKSMVSGYMRLLQSGYDRITDLGGDCDPVDVMERDDAYLREARAALAAHRKQGGEA